MITSHHKKTLGVATLILTVILLVTATLIVIFAAEYIQMETRIAGNQLSYRQAQAAAEAGLEYGINYLKYNSAAILAGPSSGYIQNYTSSNTTNVSQSDSSTFTIVYSNPTAYNYNLILISSTGTSADGTATRTIGQEVQFGSLLLAPTTIPIYNLSSVSIGGNATITNSQSTTTIQSGSTVSLAGNAMTVNSGGISSTPGNIKSDIQQNLSSLQALNSTTLFEQTFGMPVSTMQNEVVYYYSNTGSTNYSSTLNNKKGTSILINQSSGTASVNGNTTIGSATSPVLLIIDGNVSFSGNVTIYGFVYLLGPSTIGSASGNVSINGALMSVNPLSMTGNVFVTYSSSIINQLQSLANMQYYAKVPGSWKDF